MHSGHIVSVKKLSTDLSDEEAIERCRLAFENSGRDEIEQSRLSVRGYRQLVNSTGSAIPRRRPRCCKWRRSR